MAATGQQATKKLGVKLVRGPFVSLPPHELSCETDAEVVGLSRTLRKNGHRLAADLFCGAGGLSLGLEEAGFTSILGVDHDKEAVETHRHHFPGLTADWDLADPDVVAHVGDLLKRSKIELLAGGPPCQPFSKAGRSMLRDLVRSGRREAHDERKDLWLSFLEVARISRPRAVLMENVPDMALDRDMLVLRTMVDELEALGYGVSTRIVESWRYEVPQHRQRLLLVAMEGGRRFDWPADSPYSVNLRQAIGDLPPVEGGWRPDGGAEGYIPYGSPTGSFQERSRAGLSPTDSHKLFDHITRPVREDDAIAFSHMDSSTKYSDLPDELKRYRDDIFDDKYKRLDYDDLSRTITAHIAKDGYWYIHPEQDRTLSVREAARVQTFPDRFRFAGPPTAAFRQIGNAVPPNVGRFVGAAIAAQLTERPRQDLSTKDVSGRLASWVTVHAAGGQATLPWLSAPVAALSAMEETTAEMRWLALLGEVMFERALLGRAFVEQAWPIIEQKMRTPHSTIKNVSLLRQLSFGVNRESRVDALIDLANACIAEPETLQSFEALKSLKQVRETVALSVARAAPDGQADPITGGIAVLRVAARFSGSQVDRKNRRSDGRMAIARMVGVDDEGATEASLANRAALAHIALFELAASICRIDDPLCEQCPLQSDCVSAPQLASATPTLPFAEQP